MRQNGEIMAIIVNNVTLGLGEPEENCFGQARKRLGISDKQITNQYVVKKSVDARKKQDIRFVYSVGFEIEGEENYQCGEGIKRQCVIPLELGSAVDVGDNRPVIVGFGPAGMFCALILARQGCRPIILEQGSAMEQRAADVETFFTHAKLNPASNIQFGEGGAGTFSDGKLTTRIGDSRCSYVLQELVKFGAPKEILQEAKPHIGTDELRRVVVNLRKEIIRLGGEVHFNVQLQKLHFTNGKVQGFEADGQYYQAERVVLAIGHSARDTIEALWNDGIAMEVKPFSVGVRIEHLQTEVDKALYGELAGHPQLPKGEYQLSHRDKDGRAVYTFCMCPGGYVVPSASETGGIVTNGMSYHSRDGKNANAALVVSVDSNDFGSNPMDAIRFQRKLEQDAYAVTQGYCAPIQTVGCLLNGKAGAELKSVEPTYSIGTHGADFSKLFTPTVLARLKDGLYRFGKKQPGFDAADAVLTAPETRTSSPVRVLRGEDYHSITARGLYPCGEGGGYAGGIMSAAVDGIRVAQQILSEINSKN